MVSSIVDGSTGFHTSVTNTPLCCGAAFHRPEVRQYPNTIWEVEGNFLGS